ncbi:hypothetical protein GFER_07230 [Geoalkalibacter ferrihydriticus DSM 17813]|uniref:Uncharacterized protein n=3 Tax=Geoalkalibacter ferrihydriticus TaxID=392333 RepID=A0A0C2HVX1_9BACT|nr:hypothetical protein GFER_07230 [Geoalkalibacter ferrihydriticus DSM 17813]
MPAHFGGLARMVEHYGPVYAVSGGSSASLTSFILDSIQMNPAMARCGEGRCDFAAESARIALALKSFQGYTEYLAISGEILAIYAGRPIIGRIQAAGIEEMLASDPVAAQEALKDVLRQEDLARFVNPELIELVQSSQFPEFHIQDIIDSNKNFGRLSADESKILFRPGLISFAELSRQLGITASFYAGYEPANLVGYSAFLDACAERSVGKPWSEIREISVGEATCGKLFYSLMGEFDQRSAAGNYPSRLDDTVGAGMPALISTSVLTGAAVNEINQSQTAYVAGESEVFLNVNFNDVRFGYWGSREAMSVLETTTNYRSDLKSKKALGLGEASWRMVLQYSPVEPGLDRALPIDDFNVSAGGWSDLSPVLVLKDIGCDKVVFVTRAGDESVFATGVAEMLGMTQAERADLYDLTDPESSASQSLREADAILCTNWNEVGPTSFEALINDAYNAPLQTTDPFFTGKGYANVVPDTGKLGCTVRQ